MPVVWCKPTSGQPRSVRTDGLPYPINGGATAFIGCLDYPQRLTRDDQLRLSEQIRTQSPVFGFGASQGLFFCEGVNVPQAT